MKFTQEDVDVVLEVTCKFIITAGLYDQPIDLKNAADLLMDDIQETGIRDSITNIELVELRAKSTNLIPALGKHP